MLGIGCIATIIIDDGKNFENPYYEDPCLRDAGTYEEMMENLEAKIQSFKNSMSPGSTNDQNPIKKHSSPEQVARTNT